MIVRSSYVSALFVLATVGCAAETSEPVDEFGDLGETYDVGQNLQGSSSDDHLVDVPFYFAVPRDAVTLEINRSQYSYPTIWETSTEVPNAGLRLIAITQQGTSPAAKRNARLDMSRQLAKAGVLENGDIALSFRPELAGTMAYPHIQMGTTHASLVYLKNGEAYNVDSPLDNEYVGQFNTAHFIGKGDGRDFGTDALQIVRPRNFDDARRDRLQRWAAGIAGNRARGLVKFQSDYLTTAFASRNQTTRQTVTTLGKIVLGASNEALPMYCSEFAWHVLALSNCTDTEIRAAGPEGAECVDPVFEPMPLVATDSQTVGLAEGPLLTLGLAEPFDRVGLLEQIFANGNAGKLSSGHRAVAEQVAPLMAGLSQYFQARAAGATAEQAAEGAAQLNANVGPNYSPTAFLVNAAAPEGVRQLDYVATVVFVDGNALADKAKRLALPPGSSLPPASSIGGGVDADAGADASTDE